MGSKRETNYDLLRVICMIAVVMIHVSATWFTGAVKDISQNGLLIENIQSPAFICIYKAISRFAVPCFLMLSGAFILDNKRNSEYRSFYSRSFEKIGIPVLIFSCLYLLYKVPFYFIGQNQGVPTILKSVVKGSLRDIIQGTPMYHMWYMYMLIGIYFMVPVVLRFKDSISEKTFCKVAFIFLILASVSRWTTTKVLLSWDVGQTFEYLGYFSVGYCIRTRNKNHKSNRKAALMILLGVLLELCAAVLVYKELVNGIAENDLKYGIIFPYCPLIVPASVLIFYGFTLLDTKMEWKRLSGITFFVYLIHAGVWDLLGRVLSVWNGKNYTSHLNGAIWIPVLTLLVFVVSCLLSKLYIWLWNKIDKNKRITKRLLKLVHLQISEETGQ